MSTIDCRPGTSADWTRRGLPIALALAACTALAFDLPLARWVLAGGTPKWLIKICTLSEVFAHGMGVGLIALVIFTLDPARRAQLPRVLAASLGAGLVADIFKLLIARARPHHFDFSGSVLDTFGPLFPLTRGGSGLQSFPSSHAATAAGLAVALAWLYPHGRRLFALLAVLACLQRWTVAAHFASDVLAGGCLGCLIAGRLVGPGALGRTLDRWESAWVGRGLNMSAAPRHSHAGSDPARRRQSGQAAAPRMPGNIVRSDRAQT